MSNVKELEEKVANGIDLTNVNIEAVESGVLKKILEYDPTGSDYFVAWSRTEYSRKVKPCRVFWP